MLREADMFWGVMSALHPMSMCTGGDETYTSLHLTSPSQPLCYRAFLCVVVFMWFTHLLFRMNSDVTFDLLILFYMDSVKSAV